MKIRSGYVMRKVGIRYVIVALGKASESVSNVMKTNETGAFIWNALKGEVSQEQIVDKLVETYEVEQKDAILDVEQFISMLRAADLLEE